MKIVTEHLTACLPSLRPLATYVFSKASNSNTYGSATMIRGSHSAKTPRWRSAAVPSTNRSRTIAPSVASDSRDLITSHGGDNSVRNISHVRANDRDEETEIELRDMRTGQDIIV